MFTLSWLRIDPELSVPVWRIDEISSRLTTHDEIRKIESMPLVDLGLLTYNQSGCSTCHSLDGSPKVGPSFKGLFGKQEKIVNLGALSVDENYLRESILEPQSKIVDGFPPSMPTFKGQLSDRRISGLIEYIKTIK